MAAHPPGAFFLSIQALCLRVGTFTWHGQIIEHKRTTPQYFCICADWLKPKGFPSKILRTIFISQWCFLGPNGLPLAPWPSSGGSTSSSGASASPAMTGQAPVCASAERLATGILLKMCPVDYYIIRSVPTQVSYIFITFFIFYIFFMIFLSRCLNLEWVEWAEVFFVPKMVLPIGMHCSGGCIIPPSGRE